ncbi:MAG: cytochrome C [Rhodospirillaceae bacterium]|nr:cytochrome C [Rhodospirillaceae bacterium]MBT7356290.1 cytochrome C [Rhodospirillaceae bacterium]
MATKKDRVGGDDLSLRFTLTWTSAAVATVVGVVLLSGAWFAQEAYTSQSSFCGGSCHTMTEQYEGWKSSKHHASKSAEGTQAECVDCHFLPGEKHGFKAKMEGLRHLAAYLYDPEAPLPIRPVIKDGACLQSGCHSVEKLQDKELKFTEKVRFKHKPHFGDKALKGQKLTCDTCHFKVTEDKHFEVPKDVCFLCHLKLGKQTLEVAEVEKVTIGEKSVEEISFRQRPTIDFNQGASKCDICHIIPTKSLQGQLSADDSKVKAITHQSIKEAGVACEGCHFEVVKGHGEINTGNVVSNGCLKCHNRSDELLSTAANGKLMHDEHIAKPRADCFDCHGVIEHKNRTDHLDFVREDCTLCHQDQHKYQKYLLAGIPVTEGIRATPHLMFSVNTNCMGCHLKKSLSKGHTVRTGAPETCAACHTPEHKKMLSDWRKQVGTEITGAEEVLLEAQQARANAKLAGVNAETLSKVDQMITSGIELLDVVRIGNGVHNKKYAITIIDEVYGYLEDAIDLLAEGG